MVVFTLLTLVSLHSSPLEGSKDIRCMEQVVGQIADLSTTGSFLEPINPSRAQLAKEVVVPCERDCRPSGGYRVVRVTPSRVIASSTLGSKQHRYDAQKAADGDATTAWVEGVKGAGIGQGLAFFFDGPERIDVVRVIVGFGKSKRLFYANNRASRLHVLFGFWEGTGSTEDAARADKRRPCEWGSRADGVSLIATRANMTPLQWNLSGHWCQHPQAEQISHVVLRLGDVVKGTKYDDTAISEVEFYRLVPQLGTAGWVCTNSAK